MSIRQGALRLQLTKGLPLGVAQLRIESAERAQAASVKAAIRRIQLAERAAASPPRTTRVRQRTQQLVRHHNCDREHAIRIAEQEAEIAKVQASLTVQRIVAARQAAAPATAARMGTWSGDSLFLFRDLVPSSARENLVWIQLAQVGSFEGHAQGAFELTPKVFASICANFKRDGLPIPIDAEHASEMPPNSGSIPAEGATAMGWIHALDNRGNAGLWGQVEWLEPARSYIKEGRYKFLSPAIHFKSKDRVTGEQRGPRLSSAAITNQPFLNQMQPLAASARMGGR